MEFNFYGYCPSIDNLTFLDYPEKGGHALTIFFSGCDWNCRGCQNKQLQDLGVVKDCIPYSEFVSILKETCLRLRTNNVVLMGGDPLHPQNREFTKKLIDELKDEYNFCVYTGYIIAYAVPWAFGAKYIKTNGYDERLSQKSEKTSEYFQLASSNQQVFKFTNNKYEEISKNGRIYFND